MARAYPVLLNVYDVQASGNEGMTSFISKVNKIGRDLGLGGVFHGAIQIEHLEWSYGWCEQGTGVYAVEARSNPMYVFREAISLGETSKSKQEIKAILQQLRKEWQGELYELLSKNCCHFCEAFAAELGVQPVPGWVNRLASSADATVTFTNDAVAVAKQVSSSISKGASWLKDSMGRMLHRSSSNGALSGAGSSHQDSRSGRTSPEPSSSSGGGAAEAGKDIRAKLDLSRVTSSSQRPSPLAPERPQGSAAAQHAMRGLAVQRFDARSASDTDGSPQHRARRGSFAPDRGAAGSQLWRAHRGEGRQGRDSPQHQTSAGTWHEHAQGQGWDGKAASFSRQGCSDFSAQAAATLLHLNGFSTDSGSLISTPQVSGPHVSHGGTPPVSGPHLPEGDLVRDLEATTTDDLIQIGSEQASPGSTANQPQAPSQDVGSLAPRQSQGSKQDGHHSLIPDLLSGDPLDGSNLVAAVATRAGVECSAAHQQQEGQDL